MYVWLEIELKKEYVVMGLPPVVISRVNFNVSNCPCKTKFTVQNSLL